MFRRSSRQHHIPRRYHTRSMSSEWRFSRFPSFIPTVRKVIVVVPVVATLLVGLDAGVDAGEVVGMETGVTVGGLKVFILLNVS